MNIENLRDKDFYEPWMERFSTKTNKEGEEILTTEHNIKLVLNNDSKLNGKIVYNMLSNRTEKTEAMPWDNYCPDDGIVHGNMFWTDDDFSGVVVYLGETYGLRNEKMIRNVFRIYRKEKRYHPIRNYLRNLKWDGKNRVETIFIDFFGADDNAYIREISRLFFTAAVKRIFEPGSKFDNIPVLVSAEKGASQGIGKTTFWEKIVTNYEWFNASLDDKLGKEAMNDLQGKWIVSFEELSIQRKSDVNTFKDFVSRTCDTYRKPYAQDADNHLRQCVFIGNSNTSDFLRDWTSNRRFWPIDTHPRENVVKWNKLHPEMNLDGVGEHWRIINEVLTKEYVDQIWAEAYYFYTDVYKDKPLTLFGEAAKLALQVQKKHEYQSSLYDEVEQFLNIELPFEWEGMSKYQRRAYIKDGDYEESGFLRTEVSLKEIAYECLGIDGRIPNADNSELKHILSDLGWRPISEAGQKRCGPYGVCRNVYVREDLSEALK